VSALGDRNQHLLLAVDQRGRVVAGDLEIVAVSNSVGGAGLDAEPTEDAAVVVDVIDLGITFAATDA